jgi:hypothetical protein
MLQTTKTHKINDELNEQILSIITSTPYCSTIRNRKAGQLQLGNLPIWQTSLFWTVLFSHYNCMNLTAYYLSKKKKLKSF